ncbi:MAG: cation diffusion facilitator family transporter [Alphaproteobacteria bacterium]|nr:cation diffusion facilitator family transporter [Alphaproteobacteria bacterium]
MTNDELPAGHGPVTSKENGRLMKLATYASVSVACLLIALKTGAWIATESIAMLSTLVDSLLDALASIVNLVAVRHALTPADQEHRFGHGKAEALSAMAQSAFIAGSSVLLLFQAGERFIHPRPLGAPEAGIWVMAVSIVLTFALVAFQLWVVRRTKSVAVAADSLHYKGDILVNMAVIAALVLGSWFGLIYADPIFGTVIAFYILYNAWLIVRDALDMLMDRELPDDERQKIREIALTHADVESLHDMRTRRSGQTSFIQFHLVMNAELTLLKAHEVSDEVELELHRTFPDAEILIHQDPTGIVEKHAFHS